jgi:hypothetical protein
MSRVKELEVSVPTMRLDVNQNLVQIKELFDKVG